MELQDLQNLVTQATHIDQLRAPTTITGWAVAITCCISSHSAKDRKMADFDPSGSRNP